MSCCCDNSIKDTANSTRKTKKIHIDSKNIIFVPKKQHEEIKNFIFSVSNQNY